MKRSIVVAASLLLIVPAFAQAPGRVQTATRFVTIFSNLENQLWDAVTRNDTAAAARLLADDFAQWSPEPPGSPTPREKWLQTDRHDMANFRVRQMSAKDFGEVVVVNYLLTSDLAKAFFVVDVWKKAGAEWQLTSRYLSATDAAPYRGEDRPWGKN